MKLHVYLIKPGALYYHPLTKWRVSYRPHDMLVMSSIGFPSWREAMDAALEVAGGVAA